VLANFTGLEVVANNTKDAWQFKDADLDEQVESWQASQSMVVITSMVALGATAIHLLLLLGWWLQRAWHPDRHVPQALVFPVAEHTLAGIVAQPLALAAAVVLLQPCALPGVRAAAAAGMVGLLVYMAAIFLVLLAVATRRHELGLLYIHAQDRCVPWLLCRNGLTAQALASMFPARPWLSKLPPSETAVFKWVCARTLSAFFVLQAGCASCQARCSSCRSRLPTSLGAECRSS
jgi:hypothetical protein